MSRYSEFKITIMLNSRKLASEGIRSRLLKLLSKHEKYKNYEYSFEDCEDDKLAFGYKNPFIVEDSSLPNVNYVTEINNFLEENCQDIRTACDS